jgi:hypothetical protein
MFHVIRVATIHPLLAHFTLGGLPLMIVAYFVAATRRSPAWTLVGDAALVLTAALTLGTGVMGLVSNAIVPWPGGIEGWRWLHLGFGVATTALLAAFALVRLMRRRTVAGGSTLLAALVVAGVAGVTGWIGGEVLVFHAGMAVRAAGDGALAPPVSDSSARPRDFLAAMRQTRAAWASINSRLASMLVQHPRDEDFARIIVDAKRMQALTQVMADEGAKEWQNDTLTAMSTTLGGDAGDIEEAARKKNLQDLASALGQASSHCADCHEQLRWK